MTEKYILIFKIYNKLLYNIFMIKGDDHKKNMHKHFIISNILPPKSSKNNIYHVKF